MKILIRSLLLGFVAVSVLLGVIALPMRESGLLYHVQTAAYWLLGPGILARFRIGPPRIHDISFWVGAALLDFLLYTLFAYVLFRILGYSYDSKKKTVPGTKV